MADLDFSTLVPQDADVPKMERTRAENPFEAWLRDSYEHDQGKSVTVPAATVTKVEYLLRRAADDLGIGVRVVVQDAKGNTLDKAARKAAKGNVNVLFQGKDRKAAPATKDQPDEAA